MTHEEMKEKLNQYTGFPAYEACEDLMRGDFWKSLTVEEKIDFIFIFTSRVIPPMGR